MYVHARSRTCVNTSFSEEFEVKVGMQKGWVVIPLMFIIVVQELSHKFCVGYPWEMLYAYDLPILDETFEGLIS